MECEIYIKDENCRNMGCIFQNVSIGIEKAYFLVNGSSKDSLIQFYDEYIDLYKIGKSIIYFSFILIIVFPSQSFIPEKEPYTLSHLELRVRDCGFLKKTYSPSKRQRWESNRKAHS